MSAALAAITGSDTVHICPGDFHEGQWIFFGQRPEDEVWLKGAGKASTVVHGVEDDVLIAIPEGRLMVSDMTLRGGSPHDDCDVWDEAPCGRTTTATGVKIGAERLLLERVRITDNEADLGGGIWLSQAASVHLKDSEVVGNRGTIGAGGAAIGFEDATLISENTTWQDNEGGDIAFVTYADDPDDVIVHGTFNADGATDFTCTFDTLTCE